ncbi:MAG: prepilin-type N-terminal cleavage/methylation domain-containing protein [Rhodocyclaceae bacterium]|nr:prepilin-type N-terminal cleavage/methylation domain-containing protein [Rhodocyclaceae bacterium]
MRKAQQGFTLIELMIVVAIIGILAAIAIPQYQDYVTRARWQDNISSMEAVKVAIAECTQTNAGDMTACDTVAELGLTAFPTPKFGTAPSGTLTTSGTAPAMTINIPVAGSTAVGGCTVTIIGTGSETQITWSYVTTSATGCSKKTTGFVAS